MVNIKYDFYLNVYNKFNFPHQGDSGGPLLKQLPSGRWITIGIVSWGISCGQRDLPGVYTRVESYMNWIAGHIADSNP